jgi:4'-phosphopantetheinyl transferase
MNGSGLEPVPHGLSPDVRLWWVDLDAYARAVPLNGLSREEEARAARMVPGQDGRRYRAARHALRRVVAEIVNAPPESLVIEPDDLGKPRLHGTDLQFNLSHSAGEALIGVSPDRAIGVDIEVVHEVVDAEALARAHFTDAERAEWSRAAAAPSDRTFLTCWTRKEACVKALGVGLSAQPESVEAGCTPDARVVTVRLGAESCDVALESLRLPGESVAAVALATPEGVQLAREFLGRT